MQNFFNPAEHAEILIPMYGRLHLSFLFILLLLVPIFLWKREAIRKLVNNRKFVSSFMIVFLTIEAMYWFFIWFFKVEPMYERFPLHMCASMALVMPILVLKKKDKAILFFSFWAVPAGFISLVNPSFIHDAPWSFAFIQYIIRHFVIFSIPFFFFIGYEYKISYKFFLKSLLTFAGYAVFIFFLNWATDSNYLHLGRNNSLAIPFLPGNLAVWPYTLASFSIVGILVLHLFYFIFKRIERTHSVKA